MAEIFMLKSRLYYLHEGLRRLEHIRHALLLALRVALHFFHLPLEEEFFPRV